VPADELADELAELLPDFELAALSFL
jgi:hypothetical protein